MLTNRLTSTNVYPKTDFVVYTRRARILQEPENALASRVTRAKGRELTDAQISTNARPTTEGAIRWPRVPTASVPDPVNVPPAIPEMASARMMDAWTSTSVNSSMAAAAGNRRFWLM